MKILYGKPVAEKIYADLHKELILLTEKNICATLAVVIVGNRKDSHTYVRMKKKMCKTLGIKSVVITLPEDTNESICIDHIRRLNADQSVHGILIQLPLPNHINTQYVLQCVDVNKDVDGFTNENAGNLFLNTNPVFSPCTPEGCIELLRFYNIEIEGKHAVVVGRSKIVGLPLAHLLLQNNATVTICHSKTKNIEQITRTADLLFVACGKPKFITKNMIKKDAVILDIGINVVEDHTNKRGYVLVGDVDQSDVESVAQAITPVPKGIGPLTICMLMKHVVKAANRF